LPAHLSRLCHAAGGELEQIGARALRVAFPLRRR
jgi:hypothetical protein